MEPNRSIEIIREPHTDVLYVNVCVPRAGERVDTIDIGEGMGFDGIVSVRVSEDRATLYGLTIQNYSRFKKQMMWKYYIWSTQRALELILGFVRAGLCLEHRAPSRRYA